MNYDGIDVEELKNHLTKTGGVKGFANYLSDLCILEDDCDILIPAALEKAINKSIAPNIKAKLIAEGGNGTTTFEADSILQAK